MSLFLKEYYTTNKLFKHELSLQYLELEEFANIMLLFNLFILEMKKLNSENTLSILPEVPQQDLMQSRSHQSAYGGSQPFVWELLGGGQEGMGT